jgi:hypothetical protein
MVLVFPTAHLPSPCWRPAGALALLVIALTMPGLLIHPRQVAPPAPGGIPLTFQNPLGVSLPGPLATVIGALSRRTGGAGQGAAGDEAGTGRRSPPTVKARSRYSRNCRSRLPAQIYQIYPPELISIRMLMAVQNGGSASTVPYDRRQEVTFSG